MTPKSRRVIQALLYELIAVAVVGPALALMFDKPASTALSLAIFMSSVALAWSYVFNGFFENWERKQTQQGRSLLRRVVHASGFEGGLVVMLVPVMAWWLDITVVAAFLADLGVLAFFFVYSFVFTWSFDRVFGLPASAAQSESV
jgi:uncharacterized membrane protein